MVSRFQGLVENLPEVLALVGRILWPQNFMAVKVRLFSLLTIGLIVKSAVGIDLSLLRRGGVSSVDLKVAGADLVSVLVVAVTLAFLVMADIVIFIRRRAFDRELLEFAKDPSVSEPLKRDVIHALLDERNRRF